MNCPVFKLNACEYNKLNENTPVFNINEVGYHLYVHLNPDICRNLSLYEVEKIVTGESEKLNIPGDVNHDSICWLKIKFDSLSKEPGQHVYKLCFVNTCTSDTVFLYFSYIIQDDNPDKSYVYMKDSCDNIDAYRCPYLNQNRYEQ